MNSTLILEIVGGIFYQPSIVFARLKMQKPGAAKYFILAGLPFIFLGALGRAWSASFAWEGTPGIFWQLFVIHMVSFSITFLGGTYLVSRLATHFKSIPDAGQTLVLVMTAYFPFLAALALGALFPDAALIRFIGLTYTILVFGIGTGFILDTPPAKKIGFTMIAFFILFGGNYVVNLLLELLFLPQPTI